MGMSLDSAEGSWDSRDVGADWGASLLVSMGAAAVSGEFAIQGIGILCIIVGLVGGGVKLAGNEVGKVTGAVPRFLVAAFGALLLFFGPGLVEARSRFRVESVVVNWDQPKGDACSSSLPYTAIINTSGGSGQGKLKYRVLVDGESTGDEELKVDESGAHSVIDTVSFTYTPETMPRGPSEIRVETLEPTHLISNTSSMRLYCDSSSEDLAASIESFFKSYTKTVAKYGRSSSAVTHEYFKYPLNWYGKDFRSEDEFVCYIRKCKDPEATVSPSPSTTSTASTTEASLNPAGHEDATASPSSPSPAESTATPRARCKYDPVKVKKIDAVDGTIIKFEGTIDWHRGPVDGQTLLRYTIVRESGSSNGYRISSAEQDRRAETCA